MGRSGDWARWRCVVGGGTPAAGEARRAIQRVAVEEAQLSVGRVQRATQRDVEVVEDPRLDSNSAEEKVAFPQ